VPLLSAFASHGGPANSTVCNDSVHLNPVLHFTPPASKLCICWFSALTNRLHHPLSQGRDYVKLTQGLSSAGGGGAWGVWLRSMPPGVGTLGIAGGLLQSLSKKWVCQSQLTPTLTTFNLTLVCPPGASEALHPTCCPLPQKPSAGLHILHSFTPNPGTIVRPQRYAARAAPAQHSSQPLAAGAAIRAAAAASPTPLGFCYSRAG
jgi:hypothetical protein